VELEVWTEREVKGTQIWKKEDGKGRGKRKEKKTEEEVSEEDAEDTKSVVLTKGGLTISVSFPPSTQLLMAHSCHCTAIKPKHN
jgi:hypothetical protein